MNVIDLSPLQISVSASVAILAAMIILILIKRRRRDCDRLAREFWVRSL